MDLKAVLESTDTAAYAVSGKGRIVAWNHGAERLLGFKASRVIGRPCCKTLAGMDVFGNRFCGESCPVRRMVDRREAVHDFDLVLRDAWGSRVRLHVFILVLEAPSLSETSIIHLLCSDGDPARDGDPEPSSVTPERSGSAPSQLRLTAREIEILRLLEEGHTTREMADQLYICPKTVRNHIQNIHEKLGVHNRLEAVFVARRATLI